MCHKQQPHNQRKQASFTSVKGAIFIPKNKEEEIMSEKAKSVHNAYCYYEIAKAKQPSRIYSVRPKHKSGIKTHNMSKAMLAQTLASLF